MATEIEHKYLVDPLLWKTAKPLKISQIRQGYLSTDPNKTIRIRTKDAQGFVTIKGKTVSASRLEFEYEIPLSDANEMLDTFCTDLIEKTRHLIQHDEKMWEVDVFSGSNTGLILAEIELSQETENYSKPVWVTQNVTDDPRYANSNLALKPFSSW